MFLEFPSLREGFCEGRLTHEQVMLLIKVIAESTRREKEWLSYARRVPVITLKREVENFLRLAEVRLAKIYRVQPGKCGEVLEQVGGLCCIDGGKKETFQNCAGGVDDLDMGEPATELVKSNASGEDEPEEREIISGGFQNCASGEDNLEQGEPASESVQMCA